MQRGLLDGQVLRSNYMKITDLQKHPKGFYALKAPTAAVASKRLMLIAQPKPAHAPLGALRAENPAQTLPRCGTFRTTASAYARRCDLPTHLRALPRAALPATSAPARDLPPRQNNWSSKS